MDCKYGLTSDRMALIASGCGQSSQAALCDGPEREASVGGGDLPGVSRQSMQKIKTSLPISGPNRLGLLVRPSAAGGPQVRRRLRRLGHRPAPPGAPPHSVPPFQCRFSVPSSQCPLLSVSSSFSALFQCPLPVPFFFSAPFFSANHTPCSCSVPSSSFRCPPHSVPPFSVPTTLSAPFFKCPPYSVPPFQCPPHSVPPSTAGRPAGGAGLRGSR